MKKLLLALGCLAMGSSLWASGNSNPLIVSSGSYKPIDIYDNASGGSRQAVVLGDSTSSSTVHVDSIQGLQVYLGTSTSVAGEIVIAQPTVLGATVTYNGTQQVNVGTLYQPSVIGATVTFNGIPTVTVGNYLTTGTVTTLYQPSVIGATVTFNGTQNVQLQTGSNIIGTVVISSANGVSGSTIAVVNANGVALKVDGSGVTQPVSGSVNVGTLYQPTVIGATVTYNGTQAVNVGTLYQPSVVGATVTFNGTQTVNVATGGVTSAQGPPGTLDWPVRVSTTNISVVIATVTIQAPNNNTTAIPVSGSLSASVVNITTAAWDTAIPGQGVIIGGVGPTGLMQSFAVDSSSQVKVTGSFSASLVNITTAAPNGTMPTALSIVGGVNASGFAQTFAVDTSSRIQVAGSFSANSIDITTTTYDTAMPGYGGSVVYLGPTGLAQSPRVDIASNTAVYLVQPTVVGATVTYNGIQTVTVGNYLTTGTVTTLYQPTVVGATVTFNGTQTVNVATGGVTAAQIGTWTVNVATGGVTAAQGGTWTVQPGNTPNTQDWHVTMATNAVVVYQPTVLGATVTYQGTQTVNIATGGVSASLLIQGNSVGYQANNSSVPVSVINAVNCDSSTPVSVTGSGSTEIVALATNRKIYVCTWNFMSGGTSNIKWIQGTGTACATGSTDITGAYPLIAQTGISSTGGFSPAVITASGNALCLNSSSGVQISGVVTWGQY